VSELVGIVLSKPFSIYGKESDAGIYENFGDATLAAEQSIFQLIMTAGVYISVCCAIIAGIMIILGSNDKGGKLAEAKGFLVKVFIISILFFGVCGLVTLVPGMGLDS